MSLAHVRSIFEHLDEVEAWSLQLLRISNSTKTGVSYSSMEIHLRPRDKVMELASDIRLHYIDGKGAKLQNYNKVEDYDGTAEATWIYKLNGDNLLISEPYARFKESVSNPDPEGNPFEMLMHAYVLKGRLTLDGKTENIMLISMQNPVTMVRNRFYYEESVFVPIGSKILHLRLDIDVLISDDTVYLLTMAGEKLFHMEHAYKNICRNTVEVIAQENMVSDFGIFSKVATSGPHPRMFVSFDKERYRKMKDPIEREKYAKSFKLSLKGDQIDTSREEDAKRLVKLLCKKGMFDLFEDQPVEVSSARKW